MKRLLKGVAALGLMATLAAPAARGAVFQRVLDQVLEQPQQFLAVTGDGDRRRVLKYADSGDVSGDKSAVVGYMAAAFGDFGGAAS